MATVAFPPSLLIVKISSAIFDCSAPDLESCPDETLPEIAFIGRSNVGKSSLLNMITSKRDLARVSGKPGSTVLINFFTINNTWRLVDLPGYGYARVARKDKAQFNEAVGDYLKDRPNLFCVFALIDSMIPPQKKDLNFLEWLARNEIPFVIVFTKIDRARPTAVKNNMAAFAEKLAEWAENVPEMFTCSSKTGKGRLELLQIIEEVLKGD